ncbi:hypothetical protein BpHYR1_043053 [Brachionus plicatilis]|uniref:Uncharacterized protein n=1 Tax=Brachionus plicatilis TaxID=10195 RepID=A0A3M7RG05_BRAPC|nr:hypothetical protein BpHYR1_043053 [Brachionus plicatilis]
MSLFTNFAGPIDFLDEIEDDFLSLKLTIYTKKEAMDASSLNFWITGINFTPHNYKFDFSLVYLLHKKLKSTKLFFLSLNSDKLTSSELKGHYSRVFGPDLHLVFWCPKWTGTGKNDSSVKIIHIDHFNLRLLNVAKEYVS